MENHSRKKAWDAGRKEQWAKIQVNVLKSMQILTIYNNNADLGLRR